MGPLKVLNRQNGKREWQFEGALRFQVKKAGKKQRLEWGQNAYDLRPGLNQLIEIGLRVCVADVEEKILTWIPLAHVMSTAANRQVHPGMKEAAKNAWVPSTTIVEQEQRDAVDAAYKDGAQQHMQQAD